MILGKKMFFLQVYNFLMLNSHLNSVKYETP
jgi:hypothetical protein